MGPPKGNLKRDYDIPTDDSTAGEDEENPIEEPPAIEFKNVEEEPPETAETLNQFSNRALQELNPGLSRGLWDRYTEERTVNASLRKRLRQELDRVGRLRRDKLTAVAAKTQQVLNYREKLAKSKKDQRSDETRLKKRFQDDIKSKDGDIERLRSDLSSARMDQAQSFRAKTKAETLVKRLEKENNNLSNKIQSKEIDESAATRLAAEQKKTIATLRREKAELAKKVKCQEEMRVKAKVELQKMKCTMQDKLIDFKKDEKVKKRQAVVFETEKKVELAVNQAYIKNAVKETDLQRKARSLTHKVNTANQRIYGSKSIVPQADIERSPDDPPGFPLANRHVNPQDFFRGQGNGEFQPVQTQNSLRVSKILLKFICFIRSSLLTFYFL
jgi:hypothetical protein